MKNSIGKVKLHINTGMLVSHVSQAWTSDKSLCLELTNGDIVQIQYDTLTEAEEHLDWFMAASPLLNLSKKPAYRIKQA